MYICMHLDTMATHWCWLGLWQTAWIHVMVGCCKEGSGIWLSSVWKMLGLYRLVFCCRPISLIFMLKDLLLTFAESWWHPQWYMGWYCADRSVWQRSESSQGEANILAKMISNLILISQCRIAAQKGVQPAEEGSEDQRKTTKEKKKRRSKSKKNPVRSSS